MVKYRRINNTREKAFAGESIVAAGIGASATLASAAIGASATTAAAKRQALAQSQAAQTQADALKKQNDNANRLQEKQIEFTQKENEQNRDLQNQIQMNLQMLQGQQNENARLDAARIQVKKGGNPFNRAGLSSFLQAGNNMPFEVTDGGNAVPLGFTKEGYGLFMLRGDNHEEYHRTKGGNLKSGVGIKAATGQVVEGEGGKFLQGGKMNTVGRGEGSTGKNPGELMMTTPNDILFISKHKLGGNVFGYNPTLAVLSGQDDPVTAYEKQEYIKAVDNSPVKKNKHKEGGPSIHIKPENRGKFTALQERTGKSATWFKENGTPAQRKMATFALNARKWNKRKAGGNSVALFDLSNPINFSTDTIAPTVGGIEYIMNNREKQKCGGRMKRAGGGFGGGYSWDYDPNKKFLSTTPNSQLDHLGIHNALNATINYDPNKAFNQGLSGGNNTNGFGEKTSKGLSTSAMNYIGAGIDTAGALGGAIITALGNNAAARYSLRGLRDATRATIAGADALKGIDANAYKRSMFTPAHAMVAVRDPYVNLNPQLALAERSAQRKIKQAKLNSLSSAAALNRYANIETGLQDAWSQIYGRGSEISEQIKQANQNSINQIAVKNAEFDNEANREFLRNKLDILKYNNDIENQAVGIKAGALANQALGIAGIGANRVQANTQSFGNVLQSAGNSFANAMRQNVQNRNNWAMMSSGLTNTQKIDAWANAGNYDMLRDRAAYLQTIADTNKAAREELNYIKSLNIRGIFK